MLKLSNTGSELKKSAAYKKRVILDVKFLTYMVLGGLFV